MHPAAPVLLAGTEFLLILAPPITNLVSQEAEYLQQESPDRLLFCVVSTEGNADHPDKSTHNPDIENTRCSRFSLSVRWPDTHSGVDTTGMVCRMPRVEESTTSAAEN